MIFLNLNDRELQTHRKSKRKLIDDSFSQMMQFVCFSTAERGVLHCENGVEKLKRTGQDRETIQDKEGANEEGNEARCIDRNVTKVYNIEGGKDHNRTCSFVQKNISQK